MGAGGDDDAEILVNVVESLHNVKPLPLIRCRCCGIDNIWFSRCVKKNADGKNEYERLITFKSISDAEIEPLSEKVTRIIDNRTRK